MASNPPQNPPVLAEAQQGTPTPVEQQQMQQNVAAAEQQDPDQQNQEEAAKAREAGKTAQGQPVAPPEGEAVIVRGYRKWTDEAGVLNKEFVGEEAGQEGNRTAKGATPPASGKTDQSKQ